MRSAIDRALSGGEEHTSTPSLFSEGGDDVVRALGADIGGLSISGTVEGARLGSDAAMVPASNAAPRPSPPPPSAEVDGSGGAAPSAPRRRGADGNLSGRGEGPLPSIAPTKAARREPRITPTAPSHEPPAPRAADDALDDALKAAAEVANAAASPGAAATPDGNTGPTPGNGGTPQSARPSAEAEDGMRSRSPSRVGTAAPVPSGKGRSSRDRGRLGIRLRRPGHEGAADGEGATKPVTAGPPSADPGRRRGPPPPAAPQPEPLANSGRSAGERQGPGADVGPAEPDAATDRDAPRAPAIGWSEPTTSPEVADAPSVQAGAAPSRDGDGAEGTPPHAVTDDAVAPAAPNAFPSPTRGRTTDASREAGAQNHGVAPDTPTGSSGPPPAPAGDRSRDTLSAPADLRGAEGDAVRPTDGAATAPSAALPEGPTPADAAAAPSAGGLTTDHPLSPRPPERRRGPRTRSFRAPRQAPADAADAADSRGRGHRRGTRRSKAGALGGTLVLAVVVLGAVFAGAYVLTERAGEETTAFSRALGMPTAVRHNEGWVRLPRSTDRLAMRADGPFRVRVDGRVYTVEAGQTLQVTPEESTTVAVRAVDPGSAVRISVDGREG